MSINRRSLPPIPILELRDHPLMSYRGVGNWPPVWIWRGGHDQRRLRGEIGILKAVLSAAIGSRLRVFLIIEHQGEEYMGCLLFGERRFCEQVHAVLKEQLGSQIADVGSLDVGKLA